MLQFSSLADLSQVDPNSPSYSTIEELVRWLIVDNANEGFTYDPEADG